MKKEKKTRGQLISELAKLRQRIAELEKGEAEHKLKEQTLRESKELLEKTFVSQLDALFILDPNNPPKIIDCNPSTTRVFGHSRKEMLGRTTDFLHVDKRRRRKFQEHLHPAIPKQGFFHLPEFEMKRNDGTVFPTEHTVVSLEDDQGKRIGWVSLVRDISERKRAEEALRESEERYRLLVETMNEGLAMADQDYVFTYVNERFCEMLGYCREEMIGHNLIEFIHDDYKESMKDQMARRKVGEAKRFDLVWRTKNGHKIYTLVSPRGFFDAEGRFTGSLGVLTDITDLKRAEGAMRESVENFKALAQNANDGILIAVGEGDHVYANKRAAEITGYSIAELLEIGLREMVAPHEVEIVADRFKRRLEGEDVLGQYETALVRKSGESFPVELSTARTDWQGQSASIVIIHDITKRKKAEEALRKREAQLEINTNELEEVNTALRVLLKRRDEDKTDLEEKILFNVKELVVPYVERLRKSGMDAKQSAYVSILESNLNDVVSPFIHKLSSKYVGLTPTEIQIANLVKEGKTTKEIAEILHSSDRTVEFHRKNIRKKIGLVNRKVNLRSHLLTM